MKALEKGIIGSKKKNYLSGPSVGGRRGEEGRRRMEKRGKEDGGEGGGEGGGGGRGGEAY